MVKSIKECLKNWLMAHERLYWYIVVGLAVLAFGIITALGCAKVQRAEAAVAFVDDNVTPWMKYVYPDYNYYFVLESTPSQGRKVVLSTVPFSAYVDRSEHTGTDTIKVCLQAVGGDVFIIHDAWTNVSSYTQTLEKVGDKVVLKFDYDGQEYITNQSFGNDIRFESSPDRACSAFAMLLMYARGQNVIFENYPYYDFVICSDYASLYLYSSPVELKAGSKGSPYFNGDVVNISISFSNNEFVFNSLDGYKSYPCCRGVNTSSNYALYSNYAYDKYLYGSYEYEHVSVPFPAYESLTGTAKPTPTPTPTPLPPQVTYNGDKSKFDTIRLKQEQYSDGSYNWRFTYNTTPLQSTSIYTISRVVLPSADYIKANFYSGDSSDYLAQSAVNEWRYSDTKSDSIYIDYEQTELEGIAGFNYARKLDKFIEDNWEKLYGNISNSYLSDVLRYAYPFAVAVRSQFQNGNTVTVGPTTVTLPVRLYLNPSEYAEDLNKLDGYVETVIYKNTYGLSMNEIIGENSSTIDKEVSESENALKEQNKVVEDLKAELEKVNAELEAINSGGLWASFGSLASGLESASNSFLSIARAVGNALGFLPVEFTACLGFVFIGLLGLAVYHAVRG
ncbi:MAG: hypothetical protein PUC30_12240 [Lachnospiraceae bacterium]|nr:hypothetical protein [Lachnospiraceae bacterium]